MKKMSDDLIYRQAAIDAMDTWDKFGCGPDGKLVGYDDDNHYVPYVHYDDMVHAIKHLPSAQRTGQWINKKPRWITSISMTVHDAYECSNCGEPGVNWWKHCVYCGASMEIEEWKIPIIERWRNERSD